MAALDVRCLCGELYHADATNLGRRLRCRRCGRAVEIRPPQPTPRAAPAGAAPRASRRSRSRGSRSSYGPRARDWLRRLAGRRRHRVRRSSPRPRGAARALTLLAWGYLAAVALFAVVMWGLGDRWWGGTVLLFLGRWVFLLPLAILVPAALVLRRRLLLPLALGALVTLGPIMGLRTGWRGFLPEPAGEPFRVVTLNVGGDNGGGRTVAYLLPVLLADWSPDLVAFQECGHALGRMVRQLEGWHHGVADGLCLLSRHPIREAAPMHRGAIQRLRANSGGAGGAGFVVRYAIDTPAGPIDVTNLHLETPRKGLEVVAAGELERLVANTEVREVEARLARGWVDRGRHPPLVVGDFNTTVESRIFQAHWGDFADAFSHAGRGFGMTKHNGWIRARIDHVLAGPGWHVRDARVGHDLGSDHRPLVVDLVLTAP